jgi:HAD superfamily hydrolase (TIGR01549 family)
MKIKAIIWDYDGTLVDTWRKNLNVTKAIISEVFGNTNKNFSVLSTLENYEAANIKYSNWRELYSKELKMDDKQIDFAGSLWTKYQLLDKTPVDLFDGLKTVISGLKNFKQGIVSQNSFENIRNSLNGFGLLDFFNMIIGYEEIGLSNQKPHPDGLMLCINKLGILDDELVIYIGDHQTDFECAFNANNILGRKAVISIYIKHTENDLSIYWKYKPDYIAGKPSEIIKIIEKIKSEKF